MATFLVFTTPLHPTAWTEGTELPARSGRGEGLQRAQVPSRAPRDLGQGGCHPVLRPESANTCLSACPRNQVTCLSVSTDGSVLLSGSHDETVRLWDVQSKQCIRTVTLKGEWLVHGSPHYAGVGPSMLGWGESPQMRSV
jgi:WD40 repeat protein